MAYFEYFNENTELITESIDLEQLFFIDGLGLDYSDGI
jgi:hypothetical protein